MDEYNLQQLANMTCAAPSGKSMSGMPSQYNFEATPRRRQYFSPSDSQQPMWILKFEDASMEDILLTDELAALRAFAAYETKGWNVHLLEKRQNCNNVFGQASQMLMERIGGYDEAKRLLKEYRDLDDIEKRLCDEVYRKGYLSLEKSELMEIGLRGLGGATAELIAAKLITYEGNQLTPIHRDLIDPLGKTMYSLHVAVELHETGRDLLRPFIPPTPATKK